MSIEINVFIKKINIFQQMNAIFVKNEVINCFFLIPIKNTNIERKFKKCTFKVPHENMVVGLSTQEEMSCLSINS